MLTSSPRDFAQILKGNNDERRIKKVEARKAVEEAAESLAMLRAIGAPSGDIEAAEVILAGSKRFYEETIRGEKQNGKS